MLNIVAIDFDSKRIIMAQKISKILKVNHDVKYDNRSDSKGGTVLQSMIVQEDQSSQQAFYQCRCVKKIFFFTIAQPCTVKLKHFGSCPRYEIKYR